MKPLHAPVRASYSPEPGIVLFPMAKGILQVLLSLRTLTEGDNIGLFKWAQFNHMSPPTKKKKQTSLDCRQIEM